MCSFPRLAAPTPRQLASRYIVIGISDPSDDPSRHRVFEVSAVYDPILSGWVATVEEQDANAQLNRCQQWPRQGARLPVAPTAAACLGQTVEMIVAMVAGEAGDG